jgi:ABC-2 type transport system ATP-binding protein
VKSIVETNNLSKSFRNQKALSNFSMNIHQGDVYGLVGKNGAGKTTLIKILFGLVHESSGNYSLFEVNSSEKKISDIRKQISGIIEQPAFYPHMNSFDNLKVQAYMSNLTNFNKIDEVLQIVSLRNVGRKKVKNFSLGMKQRLGIARALLTDSKLIVLDEPTNGLDPEGIIELRELIKFLNREKGITFLISSHYINELEQVINKIGIIGDGQMIEEIPLDSLKLKLKSCIALSTNSVDDCVKALKGKYADIKCKDELILINDIDIEVAEVIKYLSDCSVPISQINKKSMNLEEYVLSKISTKTS